MEEKDICDFAGYERTVRIVVVDAKVFTIVACGDLDLNSRDRKFPVLERSENAAETRPQAIDNQILEWTCVEKDP